MIFDSVEIVFTNGCFFSKFKQTNRSRNQFSRQMIKFNQIDANCIASVDFASAHSHIEMICYVSIDDWMDANFGVYNMNEWWRGECTVIREWNERWSVNFLKNNLTDDWIRAGRIGRILHAYMRPYSIKAQASQPAHTHNEYVCAITTITSIDSSVKIKAKRSSIKRHTHLAITIQTS